MSSTGRRPLVLVTYDPGEAARAVIGDGLDGTADVRYLPDLDDPEFRAFLLAKMDLWTKSLDDWQNPLRPASLIDGTFKGGQRPLDLYWRLAKGINGVKMPAHAGVLTDDQIWDVVNFVLAVRDEPGLLPESSPSPARPTTVAASH